MVASGLGERSSVSGMAVHWKSSLASVKSCLRIRMLIDHGGISLLIVCVYIVITMRYHWHVCVNDKRILTFSFGQYLSI